MEFFEFHQKVTRRPPRPASADPAPATAPREIWTVSQLTAKIEKALKDCLPTTLLVQGEVSNFKHHAGSGHLYFTLKDPNACIDCVMFRSDAERLRFQPHDGIELLATGRIAVYGQRGRYQLYVSRLEVVGQGALELAFRQLYARLEAEGLFAPQRKKPLPLYPQRLALVTSTQTAAVQDMLKVLVRYPWLRVMIYHVPVQGATAAPLIADAIADLNARAAEVGGIDLILLGRGGGSLEDLWAFNEETVVRAVAGSRIPIVTGIGHEIDVSIADLAADYHAHTPTEAAQVATASWRTARATVEALSLQLQRNVRLIVQQARQRLAAVERHEVFRRPMDRLNAARQLLDDRQRALALAVGLRLRRLQGALHPLATRLDQCHPRHRIALGRERLGSLAGRLTAGMRNLQRQRMRQLGALEAQLNAVGPEQVLRRGFSITTVKKTGVVVRRADQVKPGDRLLTRLADGQVLSTVDDPTQLRLFE